MPYLSRNDIGRIANRVVIAYEKLPRFYGQSCGIVYPNILIEELLGLKTEYHRISKSGSLLGLTCCDSVEVPIFDNGDTPEYIMLDGNTLLIDSGLKEKGTSIGRLNFTLVHEACHQIFKMLFPKEYLSGIQRRQIYYCTVNPARCTNRWEEWKTNTLASAILMPEAMLRKNMECFGLGDKIRRLNRVFDPKGFEKFCELANYMGVSKKALSIRLKHLGMLEEEYLDDPYKLFSVYVDDNFDTIGEEDF